MLDENLLKKAGRFDVQVINPEPLEKSAMGQRRFEQGAFAGDIWLHAHPHRGRKIRFVSNFAKLRKLRLKTFRKRFRLQFRKLQRHWFKLCSA